MRRIMPDRVGNKTPKMTALIDDNRNGISRRGLLPLPSPLPPPPPPPPPPPLPLSLLLLPLPLLQV